MNVNAPESCPRHKNYQGKRRPKNGCPDCERLYKFKSGKMALSDIDSVVTKTETLKELEVCPKHKTYKGIRKPKIECQDCWTVYNTKHGIVTEVPVTEETEIDNSDPDWPERIPDCLESGNPLKGSFMCTRNVPEDLIFWKIHTPGTCSCITFLIHRSDTQLIYQCSHCGRKYKVEPSKGTLVYTDQPINKPRKRRAKSTDESAESE